MSPDFLRQAFLLSLQNVKYHTQFEAISCQGFIINLNNEKCIAELLYSQAT